MSETADDALQTRLARFVTAISNSPSINGGADIGLGTTVGIVRKQNQDRALIAFARYPNAPEKSFILGAICDGIGGLPSGDEAATLALSVFASRVLRTPRQPPDERLRSAAQAANQTVHEAFHGRSGSTISAVMIRYDNAVVGISIGDSRVYGVTKSRELKQLSRDDTLAHALGNQQPPNIRANQLIQFVGMGDDVQPHVFDTQQSDFDSLLITSDGVHSMPAEAFIQAVRIQATNVELIRRLLTLSDALGGRDNATALIVPSRFTPLNGGQPQQGISLEFWSVSGQLEIWIPILTDEYRQVNMPHSFAEMSEAVPMENHVGMASKHRSTQFRPDKKKRKRSKRRADHEDAEHLPLDITFPDKRE